jgi:hypothetical protein
VNWYLRFAPNTKRKLFDLERRNVMRKFKIFWDVGFGAREDNIECGSLAEANDYAYKCAKEEFDDIVDYGANEIVEWEEDEQD